MRKLQTPLLLGAIVLVIASSVVSTQGQIRRNNRLPGGQRGVNRPPFGLPQPGRNRPVNPNGLKKQQLQQRVMQAVGLTSVQRLRIQEIRRSHDDDVIAAGRRIRQARQALDRAIMNETYSELEVRRATEALAAAQADKIRLDSNVRSQVRSVLTSDQVQRFHQLQREMRRDRRDMNEQQQREQEKETGPPGTAIAPKPEEVDLADYLLSIS
jgi:Spy/CpxP family protein refolding chaperone